MHTLILSLYSPSPMMVECLAPMPMVIPPYQCGRYMYIGWGGILISLEGISSSRSQLSSSLFGGTPQPKQVNSWPAICSSSPAAHSSPIRLEWSGTKTVVLHMPGGVEYKYAL